MKLTTLLVASSCLAASAFGVTPRQSSVKSPASFKKPAFRKDTAASSPLFRDAAIIRGGAVPGWAAYNDALDSHPLTAKACTSLVGWALGDFLAQVRIQAPSVLLYNASGAQTNALTISDITGCF